MSRNQQVHHASTLLVVKFLTALFASLVSGRDKDLSITVVRDDKEINVQVKPEDLSPRLKQLRKERSKRKKLKAKD